MFYCLVCPSGQVDRRVRPVLARLRGLLLCAAAMLLCCGLRAQSGDVVITADTTWATGTYTLTSLRVQNGATLTVGGGSTITVTGAIAVTGSSNIVLQGLNTSAKVNNVWAGTGVTLNAGSVEVDAGSTLNADAQGYVAQAGPGAGAGTYGASYGGLGGGGTAAPVYGSSSTPTDLGSGGGTYQAMGGAGGGAMTLQVGGALTNNGIISAKGGNVGGNGFGGGGSGGSIYVTAGTLAGVGTFNASGGSNATSGSGGGGGRIAVYSGNGSSFTGFTGSTASGGTGGNGGGTFPGGVGTVVFIDTSAPNGNVNVYQNFVLPASATVQFNSLTIGQGATMSIGGGSTIAVAQNLHVSGTLVAQALNTTAQVNGSWAGQGVTLSAGSLTVDTGASINADAQGYRSQGGPGAGKSGTTNGASYGGLGGRQTADTVYGSPMTPTDLGSGGGSYQAPGGTGGGAITLQVSGTLINNGVITVNGAAVGGGGNTFGGGGAGGSIYVTTGTLAGAGVFSANGGSNLSNGNGGGGGRIAVYSNDATGFSGFAGSTASGGAINTSNGTVAGATGTVAFIDTSAPNGNVSVYQNLALPAGTTTQFHSLTVTNGATMSVGGGAQVLIEGELHITGTLYAQSINSTGQVNGTWQGRGIKIVAGSVLIDSNASILADSQGYAQRQGPGTAPVGTSDGGSYGGLGGGQAAGLVYGSATNPIDLGSGGGVYQGTAGAGGGAVQLDVSGTLTNNGVISATGAGTGDFAGGGSGGSIDVAANTIAGSGTFNASGGTNSSTHGDGGGGGRIAISYVTNSGVGQGQVSAAGGTGNANGAPGSVNFINSPVSTWILPTESAIHRTTTLQWFTDSGGTTSVSLAGPQTASIASGTGPFSSASFDTSQYPDGAYQLLLSVLNASGQTIETVVKSVVINNSVTWHSGTLTADETWLASQVHALDGNVIVPAGVTLTIQPGAVIKALAGAQIIVQAGGTLIATGSDGLPVTFTTFDDYSIGGDTGFNQGVSLPGPGEWNGISVASGGTVTSNSDTILLYDNTVLTGTLGANTTLFATQVYTVAGTLTVPNGITLNVLPGAVVKFATGAGLSVKSGATMTANGTLAQPIYFTSINDSSIGGDTNGNGGSIAAAPGDWNSMIFDGSTVSLQHVQIQYGGGPVTTGSQTGMIETTDNANVTISDSVIANSFFIGIQTGYPNNGGDTLTVTDTSFYGIEDRAINAFGSSTVHVVNDTFDGNATGVMTHGGTVDVENSVITNSIGTQFGSVALCCGGVISAFTNNDVYTTAAGVQNYVGTPDVTGQSGNISAAPVYMNGALHDYRPTYGSPLIDAADGTVANYPLTDAFGLARYNDPLVTSKTGKADANGNYPDIGAFEFVQTAPSDLDLTASNVTGPATATVGTQVQISWTVTNIGTGTAYGPWHDGVYVVTDPDTNPVETLASMPLEGQGVVLGPGGSYTATAIVTVPGVTVGSHRWEVKTNVLGEIFEGANTGNNTGVSLNPVATDLAQIVPGAAPLSGSFPGTGQSSYYKVIPDASQSIEVQLALNTGVTGAVQLFIGAGYVPSPQRYDFQQVEFNSTTASVVIPSGSTQTYYVMAYAQNIPVSPSSFSITATKVKFSLSSVSPSSMLNTDSTTLTFIGGGFTPATMFQLVGNGATLTPTSIFVADSTHAEVTIAPNGAPTGGYTAQAIENGNTLSLPNAVMLTTVSPGGLHFGGILVSVEAPEEFRAGFPSVVTLNYANNGSTDVPAPMIWLSATGAALSELAPDCSGCNANFAPMYQNSETSGLVLGINNQGPAGVLPAGAQGSVKFLAKPTGDGSVQFTTQAIDPTAADWLIKAAKQPTVEGACNNPGQFNCFTLVSIGLFPDAVTLCASYVPPGYNPAGFSRTCMQLLNKAGYQWGPCPIEWPIPCGSLDGAEVDKLLADDATALSKMGIYESDANRLMSFEMQNDGLDLFNRIYHQGAFGYGASHEFDIVAGLNVFGGAPTINYPDGSKRFFPTVNPNQPNQYLGIPGDYGVISQGADGSWTITEKNGIMYHFPVFSDQTGPLTGLDYIQDLNGNRITLSYTKGLVTSATDTFGNTISYVYDPLGHITQATDPVGRVTTYAYDILNDSAHSTFLTSITDLNGTTSLSWNEGGSHGVGYFDNSCVTTFCEPAIGVNTITYPDGTHSYYTYDALGRMASQSRDGGAETVTYTYGAQGSVTVTDALGNATTLVPNQFGALAQTIDPLQSLTQFAYDPEQKVTGIQGALGTNISLNYDSLGNVAQFADPLGNQQSFSSNAFSSLQSFTDGNGNATAFSYDPHNNLSGTTGPDGTGTQATYDPHGNISSLTNARGHTIQFTYNSKNLLASKTYSDGSQFTYTYDDHNNPQTITAPNGPTTYSYDPADRLMGVTYPNGQWIHYAYNAGGQRTSMTDSTGFAVQYGYDTAGRLAALTSGTNAPIASYTYDNAGNLSRKTLGNGTYTTYTYDANGSPVHLINYSSAGAIISEYDYTFDALGRQATANAPSGTRTLDYDADSEIVNVGGSTGSAAYTYDASGNRLTGPGATYNVNNLNEYTSAGSSSYMYDADGNLISGGGWTYAYDDENRLTGMAKGTDTWTYQYDGFGQRVSATHNGTVTQYLNDPSGFGNVEAELNGSGQTIAHYTYGLDLTSSVPATGTPAYYHFDASGNTVQMTSASGAVVNNYVYLPFGEKVTSTVGVTNPFTFVGQFGVMDEGSGLYYMRNRWYSPVLGRFVQRDPIGLSGGTNLYTYAQNTPSDGVDPSGLRSWLDIFGLGIDFSHNPSVQSVQTAGQQDYDAGVAAQSPGQRQAQMKNTIAGAADKTLELGMHFAATATGAEIEVEGNAALTWGINKLVHTGVEKGISTVAGIDEPEEPGEPGEPGKETKPGPHPEPGPEPTVPSKSHILPCLKDMANFFSGGLLFHGPPYGTITVPTAGSKDPNGKITSGFGDQGYVPAGTPIVYTIYFENQSTATLPAQKVTVTDSLASNLDWSTMQLDQIAFNNVTLNTPPGVQTYTAQTNVSTDPNPVAVNVSLNPSTGLLTWTLQSVDSTTGSAPANPLAGFLPPNNSDNAGSGYVTFSVMPKAGLANGTAIANQASIVFDANAAIATNSVTNTIDSSSVTSSIDPLPAVTNSTSIPVSWTGSDPSGSGIASYNIYVSIDGGESSLWLSATQLTSSTYTGVSSHSYTFYSIATNNVGIVQAAAVSPQTTMMSGLPQPTVTVTPASTVIASGVALNVGVTVTSTGTVPSGSVVLSIGTYSSPATTLNSGAASITVPASALPDGDDTLTVTYAPDSASSALFAAAQGTTQVTVGTSAAVAALSPATLTFTSTVGASSAAQTVQLSNTGSAPLTLTGISLTGTGASSFSQTNNCGTSLAPNANCTISVIFTPGSAATLTAALSVADNAAGSPQTVTLTGTGAAAPTFQLTASPSTQSVVAGSTATYTLQVTPQNGSFTNAVTFSVTGLPSGATASFAPMSVTPGSAGASSTLNIATTTTFAMLRGPGSISSTPILALIGIGCLALCRNRRRLVLCLLLIASAVGVTALGGCGSASHTATYTITVTATSGTQSQNTSVMLNLHN